MHAHNTIYSLVTTAAAIGLLTGCSTGAPNSLSPAEQIAATCPAGGARIAALVQVDRSGSRHSPAATPAEEHAIRDAAQRTVICSGHLRVTLFSGSMIGVVVLDADLHLDGATANARLRKAPKAIDAVMEQVAAALPDAMNRLSDGATDIVGQYHLGAEYAAQLAARGATLVVLEQTILTDGIQTAGQDLSDSAMTAEQTQALAATVVVPDLTGASVWLIGIGRQADNASLPTPYVSALRAFHTTVCEKTGASCTVVTDAAGA